MPVGSSLAIHGDGESIVWKKIHNGKYPELIRTHTDADGRVFEMSEPIGINGYSKAEEEFDFRCNGLGWEIA